MSEKTNIEWAHATFNPWIGCTKVSPGCKNCYAETMDRQRFSKTMDGGTKEKPVSHWGPGAPRHRTSAQLWKQPLVWNSWKDGDPKGCVLEITGPDPKHPGAMLANQCRRRIFPSLCDWLDGEVPIEWLADFLRLIHDTPNLDWLLLTKRPENFTDRTADAMQCLDRDVPRADAEEAAAAMKAGGETFSAFVEKYKRTPAGLMSGDWLGGKPPSNCWLGVSVEDQKRADERIPLLLETPAKVRFLSVEPLLEQVNLHLFLCRHASMTSPHQRLCNICEGPTDSRWVICGGESGSDRRDCGTEAICDVARQCVAAGVPCFVKQDCAFKPGQQGRIPDDVWSLKQFPTLTAA